MPVKILLADKSITIQKVVEMLFSGKEYEVTCVSDGETALNEATRTMPDLLLVDVDLPRMDGYRFAERCKSVPALASAPIILMLSRDDAYDAVRGVQAGITDNIAKPFESQDLIGKVKRALTAATASKPAAGTKKPADQPSAPPPPPSRPSATPAVPPPQPKQAVPSNIFDVIREAPAKATPEPSAPPRPAPSMTAPGLPGKLAAPSEKLERPREAPAKAAAPPVPLTPPQPTPSVRTDLPEENVFEVEPEFEVAPEREEAAAAPVREVARPAPAAPPQVESAAGEGGAVAAAGTTETSETIDTEPLFEAAPEAEADHTAAMFESEMEIDMLRDQTPAPRASASEASPVPRGPLPADAEHALPLGAKALEEIREGLGLSEEPSRDEPFKPSGVQSEIVSFESLDMASRVSDEDFAPPAPVRKMPQQAPPEPPAPAAVPSEASRRAPQGEVSEELIQAVTRAVMEKMGKDVIERVAWEVIPDLAERLIREEIERLKAGQ